MRTLAIAALFLSALPALACDPGTQITRAAFTPICRVQEIPNWTAPLRVLPPMPLTPATNFLQVSDWQTRPDGTQVRTGIDASGHPFTAVRGTIPISQIPALRSSTGTWEGSPVIPAQTVRPARFVDSTNDKLDRVLLKLDKLDELERRVLALERK